MSATVANARVYEAFLGADLSERTFYHGHSYSGNALAAAVALRHLALFDEWDVLANVRARAADLAKGLAERVAPRAAVKEIRQQGLMCGIELAPPAEGLRWGRRVTTGLRRARRADPAARRRDRADAAAHDHGRRDRAHRRGGRRRRSAR